jgi:hypothetical protein
MPDDSRGLLSLVADLFGVVTPVAVVIVALVRKAKLAKIGLEQADRITAIAGLIAVGIILDAIALSWRYNVWNAVNPSKQRQSSYALWMGTACLLGGLTVFLS